MKFRSLPFLLLAVSGFASAQTAIIQLPQLPKVRIGEAAPDLSVARFVKGVPGKLFAPGEVTIVEFWATWCPTCKETFKHVADLSRKYRGRANFVGISVWERPLDVKSGIYVNDVRQFAHSLGEDMPYPVMIDDRKSTIATTWLGENSGDIPKAFVIDRRGRIAWSGHPLADLDDVVQQVIAGKYDMTHALEQQEEQVSSAMKMVELVRPIEQAIQAQQSKAAVKAITEAVAKMPALETAFGPTKFMMLLQFDEPGAYTYARELAAGPCKDTANVLNLIAWKIVDDESHLKNPDLPTAILLAKQAYELTEQNDAYVTDTLAYALYKGGHKDEALKLQIKAVKIATDTKGFDPKIMKQLEDRLAMFRKGTTPP